MISDGMSTGPNTTIKCSSLGLSSSSTVLVPSLIKLVHHSELHSYMHLEHVRGVPRTVLEKVSCSRTGT